MPDPVVEVAQTVAPVVAPIVKQVGLFQDPHFWGVINTIGGVITFATSQLAIIPSPIQPWIAGAGIVWGAGAQVFHIFGLVNPASTQTVTK